MVASGKKEGPVEAFVARWQGQEGGQERANYALFLTELCDLLGVEHPAPAAATPELNDYPARYSWTWESSNWGKPSCACIKGTNQDNR